MDYRPDGRVHYRGTKFHPHLGIAHQLLTPPEFLALLLLHVLLRDEVTLRTYGALSTPFGKKVVWIEDPPVKEPPPESITQLGSPARAEAAAEVSTSLPGDPKVHTGAATAAEEEEPDEFLRKRRRNWARLIAKVWLEDPSLCRSCGKPLPIVAAITSPGQDDVTERILRHFQIQDPPWKRQRAARARAPPPASELAAAAAPSEPEFIGELRGTIHATGTPAHTPASR